MYVRSSLLHAVSVLSVGALSLGFAGGAWADFLLPNHSHTQTARNNTGAAANDLHVNLVHVATGSAPTAPPFAPGATGGLSMTFAGGTVPAGGTATVSWQSKFASDLLDPTDPGNWTFNGAASGNVTVASLNLVPVYVDLGGGNVLVRINNIGASAVAYSNLQIFNGADAAHFTPADYVAGLTTGTPVALLIQPQGTFAPGLTDVASFAPTVSPAQYSGGSMLIDGGLYAQAGAVPEPATWALFAVGAALLLALRRSSVRA